MSADQLEQRLAAIEQTLTEIKQRLDTAIDPKKPWWERLGPPMTPDEIRAAEEAAAYGRYWRKTGREAPPDWNPGDPIPEPDFDP
jgi:hypothetical protein